MEYGKTLAFCQRFYNREYFTIWLTKIEVLVPENLVDFRVVSSAFQLAFFYLVMPIFPGLGDKSKPVS